MSGMPADIFPGNGAGRKGGAMTLYELSLEYARAAAALRERLRQVEALRAAEEEEERALMLGARLRLLRSMWRDTRATAVYLEHYYQGGGTKT